VRLHPDAESALNAWYKVARNAEWRSLDAVRKVYPHADFVGSYTVFNIRGNRYRLIAQVNYQFQQVLIREILTHEEYDKEKWKS
jgi:mRNA interferase HigB